MRGRVKRYVRSLRRLLVSPERTGSVALHARQIMQHKLRARRAAVAVRVVHGPTVIPGGSQDAIVICPLRDGAEYLPHFLAHYRRLGVAHFVFIDNGSQDATREILQRQSDATVYASPLPFKHYQNVVRRMICRRHGMNRWILLADIDECFDFPHSERVPFAALLAYLEQHGFNAMAAHMLDRFCAEPVLQVTHPPDGDLARKFRYYDNSALDRRPYRSWFGEANIVSNGDIPCFFGGIRAQAFGTDDPLTKHPLLKLQTSLGGPNNAHDISYARVADISGVLHHYKFTSGFSQVLQRALREGGYFNGSAFYRTIAHVLRDNPGLSLQGPTARRFTTTARLIREGFIHTSAAYEAFVAASTDCEPPRTTAWTSAASASRVRTRTREHGNV